MTEVTTKYAQGTPSWVDLTTTDLPAAVEFYRGVFGWDVQDSGEEMGHYTMALVRGKAVAGIGPMPEGSEGVPVAWTTYLATDDIDKTLATVRENGGQVLAGPFDPGDSGRGAVFLDPTGAVAGLWEAKEHLGAYLVNEPGAVTWNELVTGDVAGARAFYEKVFGVTTSRMAGDFEYYELKVGDRTVGGIYGFGEGAPPGMPPHWGTYFAVADTDATAAKVTELGGTVWQAPQDTPFGRMASVVDPQGGHFSIISAPAGQQS